jgi:hypothetical protein
MLHRLEDFQPHVAFVNETPMLEGGVLRDAHAYMKLLLVIEHVKLNSFLPLLENLTLLDCGFLTTLHMFSTVIL